MRSPENVAASGAAVHGPEGLRGTLGPAQQGPEGERQCLVRLEQGTVLLVPADLLQEQRDGSFFLPLSPNDLAPYYTEEEAMPGEAEAQPLAEGSTTVPVVAEELKVGKRRVETGRVVVHKTVTEHEAVVDEPLMSDRYEVDRVAVNRIVRDVPAIRQEGEVTIVPLLEEVLLVQKKLMLREELRITRKRTPTHQPQRVMLRKEEAKVERIPSTQTPGSPGAPGVQTSGIASGDTPLATAPWIPTPTQERAD